MRARELPREAAFKETREPFVQQGLSAFGVPLREIRVVGFPLSEPPRRAPRSVPIGVVFPRFCGAVASQALGLIWVTALAVVAAEAAEPTRDPVEFVASAAVLQVIALHPMHQVRPDEAAALPTKAPGR